MNNSEYLIRLIIEARDQVTAKIALIRKELDALDKHFDQINKKASNIGGGNQNQNVTGFNRLTQSTRGLRDELDRTDRSSRRTNQSIREIMRSSDSLADKIKNLNNHLKNSNFHVSRLDNSLRGLVVFSALIFIEQLATGLVSLGGALVSVGTSATAAAGAIGGALTAAMAQAIPVAAGLGAAVYRLQNIFDALKQSRLVQQQDYANSEKNANKEANAIDAVANANDNLKAAQERLVDARQRLKQSEDDLRLARAGAKDELRELINAEKEARLAAEGAALSQEEAQRRLRASIQGGDVLGQQRAQLDAEGSGINADRALIAARRARQESQKAIAGGLDQLPNVKAARDALRASQREMLAASLAATKAQQGIDKAARGAAIAEGNVTAAQGKLNYLLNEQLTGSERKLYDSLNKLWTEADKATSRLAQPIIKSFTYISDQAQEILGNRRLFDAFQKTSEVTADTIKNVFDGIFTTDTFSQLEFFSEEANRNLPILGQAFVDFGKSFLNIAEAFSPIFRTLVDWTAELGTNLREATADEGRMGAMNDRFATSLESLKDLLVAVGHLIAATFRSSALEEGNSLVDSFTRKIENLASFMDDNREETNKFFKDSAEGTRIIGSMLMAIGKGIREAFNVEGLQHFANLFNKIIVPGFVQAAIIIGKVTALFDKIFSALDKFGSYDFASFLITFGLVYKSLTSIFGLLGKILIPITGMAGGFTKAAAAARSLAVAIGLVNAASVATAVPLNGQRSAIPIVPTRLNGQSTPISARPSTAIAATESAAVAGAGAAAIASRRKVLAIRAGALLGGYAAYQALPNNPESISDLTDKSRYSTLGFGASYAKLAIDNLTSLKIGKLAGQLNPFGAGGGTAGRAEKELTKFGETAETTFNKLAKARDKAGLNKLGDQAARLAEKYPTASKVLNSFAESARLAAVDAGKAADAVKRLNDERSKQTAKGGNSDFLIDTYQNSFSTLGSTTDSVNSVKGQLNKTLENVNSAYEKGSVGRIDEKAKTFGQAMIAIRKGIKEGNIDADEGYRALNDIVKRQSDNIGNNLKKGSEEGREAYARNLRLMKKATKDAMDQNVIEVSTGRSRINRIIKQMADVNGISLSTNIGHDDERARVGSGPITGLHAVGGWVGNQGERGQDNIALVGRGEAVLNYDHQRYVNSALRNTYGYDLNGLFKGTNSMHSAGRPKGYASGGIVALGKELQKEGYSVGENPAFGGVAPVHSPNSWHYKGLAIDVNADNFPGGEGPALDKLYKRLKNMRGVIELLWRTTGHYDHLHVAMSGNAAPVNVDGLGSEGFDREEYDSKIKNVLEKVKTKGLFGSIAKRALEKIAKKAGDKLESDFSSPAETGTEGGGLNSAGGEFNKSELKKLWVRAGGPSSVANIAAAIALAESGGNPNARNSIGATGLWQIYNGPGTSLSLKDPWLNAQAAVAKYKAAHGFSPWTTYTGLDTGPGGGPGPKTYTRYLAGGGMLGKDMLGPRGTGYDVGGFVPGAGAKLILAHGGEYVLTKEDAEKMKRLSGLLGVSNPAQVVKALSSDASGLTTKTSKNLGIDPIANNRSLSTAIKANEEELTDLKGIEAPKRSKVKDLLSKNAQSLIDKYYSKVIKSISRIVDEGGTLDTVRTRVESSASLRKVKAIFNRYTKGADGTYSDSLSNNEVGQAQSTLTAAVEDGEDLQRERDTLDKNFNDIDRRYNRSIKELSNLIKRRDKINKKNKEQRKKINAAITKQRKRVNSLTTARNNIQNRRDESDSRLADNIQAQVEADIALQSSKVDDITNKFESKNTDLELNTRSGVVAGLFSSINELTQGRIKNASDEIIELTDLMANTTDPGVKSKIAETIKGLKSTIIDGTVELFNNATSEVKAAISGDEFTNSFYNRLLAATGTVGNDASGGTGSITGGNLIAGKTRLSISQDNLFSLQSQEAMLSGLWNRAIVEFGEASQQAKSAGQDFFNNIAQQAEEKRTSREIQIQDVLDKGQRGLSVIDKNATIAEQIARINGTDPNAAKLGFLNQKTEQLANTRSELNRLLDIATSAGDNDEIIRLKDAILDNTIASNENTLEIKKVNGAENAQSFSTTGWERFRQAIFNGSNGLLSSYASLVPAMDTGGTILSNGYAYLHQGEEVVPAKISRSSSSYTASTKNVNVTINEAGRRDDNHMNALLREILNPNGN